MKNWHKTAVRRFGALLLTIAMLFNIALALPVSAVEADSGRFVDIELIDSDYKPDLRKNHSMTFPVGNSNEPVFDDNEVVRVSIVLEDKPTLDMGYSTINIAQNIGAMEYRDSLLRKQDDMVLNIENSIGAKLDVVWNLTLAANIVSANVRYGDIKAIKEVDGVKDVFIETVYTVSDNDSDFVGGTNSVTSSGLTGSKSAWASGYTGAGSVVAIIDTGLDVAHQSFDPKALLYSYERTVTIPDFL